MTEETERWERVGRRMLVERLELVGQHTIHEAFVNAKTRVRRGEDLRKEDLQALREAVDEAAQAVELAALASPDAEPSPNPIEFLDEDGREQYVKAAKLASGGPKR